MPGREREFLCVVSLSWPATSEWVPLARGEGNVAGARQTNVVSRLCVSIVTIYACGRVVVCACAVGECRVVALLSAWQRSTLFRQSTVSVQSFGYL